MGVSGMKLSRSFGWLNATQFLGALNDNIFKLLIILYLVGPDKVRASSVTALVGVVFVVPFLLFTAFAGKLADHFSKRDIIVTAKIAEVAAMLAGCAAFYMGNEILLYCVLFLMCTQSAFFGPSKYGIVPELVRSDQLSRANSFLEALTYLAVVFGAATAPFLAQITGGRYTLTAVVCVVVSAAGAAASMQIHQTTAIGKGGGASVLFVRDIWRTLRGIRTDRDLMLAVVAGAYFMLLGGFLQMNLIPYGIQALNFDEMQSGYLFVIAAVGIGTGSYWAGRLSGRNIEFGIVPLGAVGLAFCSVGLGLLGGQKTAIFVVIFLSGVSAGLFIVPIHAFIQFRSPGDIRGQVLAASGFLGWVGVLISAGLLYVFAEVFQMSAAQGFVVLGGLTLILAVVTVWLMPDFLVRLILLLLTRFLYRMNVVGVENIPLEGGVLLVSNHVSWIDGFLLGAAQQRRIRFVMEREYYNSKWINWFCRLMKAIPISTRDRPKQIIRSLRQARSAMDDGYIVCIFAEGAVTRTGTLRAFRGGFERIMRGSDYSVIPAYIGGAWGSIFSHYYGRLLSTMPKRLPYPVSIHFGETMASDSTAGEIRQKVIELSCDYFDSLKSSRVSLQGNFVKIARKNWRKRCVSDGTGKKLNYGQMLAGSIAVSDQIAKMTAGQDKVAILLPPSVAAAVANVAVMLAGKVPVNLSYTANEQTRASAIEQCGIKCVISSRKFIEKAKLNEELSGLVYFEDITGRIGRAAKIKAYLKGCFLPWRMLTKEGHFQADDLATVIFSSGSTGEPKGVMLSHHNILSNIEGIRMVYKIYPYDNVCGVLPFFHSFGFTFSFWLVLMCGVSANYVSNPLDGRAVAESVRKNKATILFATPTFLLNYIRRAEKEDFASLRDVVVGAEKLKERLAKKFESKFGIRPREGYGTTELSPLVSLNLADVEVGGGFQVGSKAGTIGHPIPGVAVKVVDLETAETVDTGEDGLLMVKGPNVMLGYLGKEDETAAVLRDGWYNTGDIVSMDEDGFLTITDRLARFSKIGGEMVPHLAIEEQYLHGLETHNHVVAVTSVPDAKKGEELVVLYVDEAGDVEKLHEIISACDLANICKPRRENYVKIKSMPVLGSGKLDIMKLRRIALVAKGQTAEPADSVKEYML